ncbi:MAG: response regulator, partial [Desulfatiglandales bacterium]
MIEVEAIKLLMVDDEVDFLDTLLRRLKKRGFSVKGVKDGQEALSTLKSESYDVVILDVKMPGMDGIEVLRRIKEDFPGTEVIMLTGHANVEVAIKGIELGAFDYLMKPMDIDELVFKVEDAYKKKLLRERKRRRKE